MAQASVSIRELLQNLERIIARVERGETVDVTRRRRVVARLAPVKRIRPAAAWPDLEVRARAVFGDRIIAPGASQAIVEDRER